MTLSIQSITLFADFRPSRALRGMFAAAVLAAMAGAPAPADAAMRTRVGAYDGVWNVQFATQAGNCSSNSVPFTVAGRRVSSAGGGKVTGGVGRAGVVSVQISVGASKPAAAAVSPAIPAPADGAGSSWETAAAEPGRRRGASDP